MIKTVKYKHGGGSNNDCCVSFLKTRENDRCADNCSVNILVLLFLFNFDRNVRTLY